MCKIINGIRVLSYEEWSKLPSVKALDEEFEECSMCDGSGTHVCDCGHEHDCDECDGEGKFGNLKRIYADTLRSELEKMLKWKNAAEQSVHPTRADGGEN